MKIRRLLWRPRNQGCRSGSVFIGLQDPDPYSKYKSGCSILPDIFFKKSKKLTQEEKQIFISLT